MNDLIAGFPNHVLAALEQGSNSLAHWKSPNQPLHQVVFTGLGGSGIGASLAQEWCDARLPVVVSKGYSLPSWVGPHTAVIAVSYSGDTEETLAAAAQAEAAGAWMTAITSGGALAARAEASGWNQFRMEPGNPPRSMVGYGLVYALLALDFYGAGIPRGGDESGDWRKALGRAANRIQDRSDAIRLRAAEWAPLLAGKTAAFYAATGAAALATRWRQQWNENAKLPGWDAEIPEMNHNETVGWAGGTEHHAALFLGLAEDDPRNRFRSNYTQNVLRDRGITTQFVQPESNEPWEARLEMLHLGDWLSVEVAAQSGVDVMDIRVIQELKAQLQQWTPK